MNEIIIDNLNTLFSISKCKSQRDFAKLIGIHQSNLSKKLSGQQSITRADKQKICKNLGIRMDWLERSDGEMFDENSYIEPNSWLFSASDPKKNALIGMINEENAHHNQQIVGNNASEIELLKEQIEDLRKQVASKDEQIKQLLDMLANKQ